MKHPTLDAPVPSLGAQQRRMRAIANTGGGVHSAVIEQRGSTVQARSR
jgi:hypothetical protein